MVNDMKETEEMKVDIVRNCPNEWYGNHTFERYKKIYEDTDGTYQIFTGKRCILCGVIKEVKPTKS